MKLNKTQMVDLILQNAGKITTITFDTKTKQNRVINGIVKKNSLSKQGYITIYSFKDKDYRKIDTRTIKSVSCNGEVKKVK